MKRCELGHSSQSQKQLSRTVSFLNVRLKGFVDGTKERRRARTEKRRKKSIDDWMLVEEGEKVILTLQGLQDDGRERRKREKRVKQGIQRGE